MMIFKNPNAAAGVECRPERFLQFRHNAFGQDFMAYLARMRAI